MNRLLYSHPCGHSVAAITPKGTPAMTTPANHPEFNQKWEALMRQLETVLSIAYEREPNRTQYREAISIAKYHLTQLDALAD